MRAFWITLLIYALAGPLVGLLTLMVIGLLSEGWGMLVELRQIRFASFNLHALTLYVSVAYLIGFLPAILTGALISAGRLYGLGFGYAILIGALAGFIFAVGLPTPGQLMYRPEGAIVLFLVCFVPTIVCWFLAQPWWRKKESTTTHQAG